MSHFLVTGGAGFLGINLIRHLLARGASVTSLDVADFAYPDCRERVTALTGDIRSQDDVARAMVNIDAVVHCAAALPLYERQAIFSTEVEGTRNLLRQAHERGVRRFVHVSSTAVYGIPDHHPIQEDDPLVGVGPYGEAKILAEEACEAYRRQGMCVPILRPKSFVGPERLGVFAMLYDWARDGRNFPMIGSGDNRYQLLDVEDLCRAIYLAATLPEDVANDTFNIGAREFATMKEDFQVVLDAAGHGKRVIGFPATPVIWGLRALEFLRLSPLYKWVYETACTDSFVAIDKARERLGFEPEFSNKAALLRNFRWYLDNLASFEKASGVSHRVPWKQGVLALVKRFF